MKPVTNRLAHISPSILFPFHLLWKRSKKITIVVVLVTAFVLASCFQHYYRTNTTNSVDTATLKRLQNSSKYFILHYNDKKAFGLTNVTISGDNIEGDLAELPEERKKYLNPNPEKSNIVRRADKMSALMEVHLYYPQAMTPGQTHVSVPASAFNRIDVYEFDRNATTSNHVISWIGVGLVGAVAVTLIAFAIACNCPQVYVNNNGQYEFKSGVYSGAVYSTLERSDYLYLDGIHPINDRYKFRIGNVENEEQFINQVQLMKVDHAAGVKVLADRHGKVLTYKDPILPSVATYDNTDVTRELKFPDGEQYLFDSKANENGFSAVTIRFDKPARATKGKLIVRAGNSKWSGYLYSEFASLFGNGYEKWRKQQEQSPAANAEQWQIDQSLPLKVFAETGSGWQYIDHFALTGNTASRDMIMEIDLSSIKTDQLNIRLESTFQFWNVDQAVMDFSEDTPVHISFNDPVAVTKNDGINNQDELLKQDKKYVQLTGNDIIDIEFNSSGPGNTSSLFLVSSGYYHSLNKGKGKPELQALIKFREKGAFDRFSRQKYTAIEEALAKTATRSQ
ncbi:MAG: hypothetical protein JNN00_16500 [Chitinophagaceae bacterium]|nr:hypothetical protein [Chitinophagaceae bacterium]